MLELDSKLRQKTQSLPSAEFYRLSNKQIDPAPECAVLVSYFMIFF